MRKSLIIGVAVIYSALNIFWYCTTYASADENPRQGPGYSDKDPLSIGASAVAVIKTGDWYATLAWETYDAKITLLETMSGNKAWERIKAADGSNPPSDDGFEYILARVRFEYQSTSQPGDKGFELWNKQTGSCMIARSSTGKDYRPVLILPPEPTLKGRLYSGKSCEGWVIFSVARDDVAPLMVFGREYGKGVWFKLR